MRKLKALIPVRAGSQRVINKNIRPFAGTSLLEIKINQLNRIPEIDEVIVNSNCPDMLELANRLGATPVLRDPVYASNTIPMNEVWAHLAQTTECDDIIYTNCTNPLVRDESYSESIKTYREMGAEFDSLTTVNTLQEYLWSKNEAINYDPKNHPRSQDLPIYHSLNFAISIIPRALMIKNKSILGDNFYHFIISDIESIDIDTMNDFILAESVYRAFSKKEK